MASLLVPPASIRGMTNLDRNAFDTTVTVPYLKIRPDAMMSEVMACVKKYILKVQNLKPVQDTDDCKVVYLDPRKVDSLHDMPNIDRNLFKFDENEKLEKTGLTLKYENWRSEDVLRAVLPEDVEVPTSYSKVGHIVHLNLRTEALPFKKLIGEIYLDKTSNARTVVNKLNSIDTTFRFFAMEVIAGDEDTIVKVKENGVVYEFDFARVYWNPRLCTEHATLTSFLNHGDALYDVFAGVGPFAIPAARKGVAVLANDLNPDCYKWLLKNAEINKIRGNLTVFNKDGRCFLRKNVKEDILKRRLEGDLGYEHIAMNLPALAIEFLDVFDNWLTEEEIKIVLSRPPIVHLYCFIKLTKQDDAYVIAKRLVEDKLGSVINDESLMTIHHVRNVSPNKEMMRVSFRLFESILRGEEPAKKRTKVADCPDISVYDTVIGDDGEEQKNEQDEKCV